MEDIGVDGKIILKEVFKKWDADVDWIGLDQERENSCEFGDEPSGSIKCGKHD